jgi:hypothetical protein
MLSCHVVQRNARPKVPRHRAQGSKDRIAGPCQSSSKTANETNQRKQLIDVEACSHGQTGHAICRLMFRPRPAATDMFPPMKNALSGGVAGAAATIPMTAAMLAIHRILPVHDQHAIPPRQITLELAERIGVNQALNESERQYLTAASHFGYGAAMGTVYGAVLGVSPASPIAKGLGFGLGVWAASYLGWLPAANFRASADRQGARRNEMMIAAHAVWGIGLGLLFDRLPRINTSTPDGKSDSSDGARMASSRSVTTSDVPETGAETARDHSS